MHNLHERENATCARDRENTPSAVMQTIVRKITKMLSCYYRAKILN